jgi:YggT family protein
MATPVIDATAVPRYSPMMLSPIVNLAVSVINLFIFALIVQIFLGWLVYLDIVNGGHKFVRILDDTVRKISEPLLSPIRRLIRRIWPTLSIDLSPVFLILGLYFTVDVLHWLAR